MSFCSHTLLSLADDAAVPATEAPTTPLPAPASEVTTTPAPVPAESETATTPAPVPTESEMSQAADTATSEALVPGEGQQPGQAPVSPMAQYGMWIWFAVILGFMWFFMIRPQQREQKRRNEMWDSLKIHDRILTMDGILGTITDIDTEKGVVTLRVDESNNVKVKFLLSAVSQIVTEDEETK